jgi:acyl transferase domain-containing protein/acyl carrier protein
MRDLLQRLEKLSPKKLALLAVDLQARLEASGDSNDPVALIGMGCRLPGSVTGPESLWALLWNGHDAVSEVPRDRWDIDAYYDPDPDRPGKMSSRWSGFVDDIHGFDAAFFGISPREAAAMDPQQRLLLEVCWQALEHAGQAPAKLNGTLTGVYVGMSTSDYHQLLIARGDHAIDAYMASGSAHSIAAGRVAYCLGLQGPNVAVDTACSSSLVAVHLACQALRNRECNLALAGGVNAILSPQTTITLSKAHMMAPDGRCKAFDASANGFVRAEGCGIVVLKRLADAVAGGDRILCVIRGSAINQDGRSSGITAPNGAAQERVIRRALAAAGVTPKEVGYVETHGTGTSLGDPIEAHALAAVFGGDRADTDPLLIGSVKTNLGHLEAAAGVVGLIKAALCVHRGEIPPQLHFRQLNPHIRWEGAAIAVASQYGSWSVGKRRVAGVSSFGFSGTNAHVVLEQAPVVERSTAVVDRPLHVLPVSARSESALAESIGHYRAFLQSQPDANLADICHTAGAGRSHFSHRAAFIAGSMAELLRSLERPIQTGTTGGDALEPVFLFTGQGAQYAGMGRCLYATHPTFRQAFDRCDALLTPYLPQPLPQIVFEGSADLDDTRYAQPALFTFEYALAELWMSWGVRPAAVLGHSLGEYAAACVTGVLTLEDACTLVTERTRLMAELPAGGAMMAVMAEEERVRDWIKRLGLGLEIAGVNAPENTVISGPVQDVIRLETTIAAEGVRVQRLAVSNGFHSHCVEPMLATFEQCAASLRLAPPTVPFVSSVTGAEIAAAEICTPTYWSRQVRQTVQFRRAIGNLIDRGHQLFLEIGPGSTLCGLGRESARDIPSVGLASVRRRRDEWQQMLETRATLYTSGCTIDWDGFDRPYRRRKVSLPVYPFEHRAFRLEPATPAQPLPTEETQSRQAQTSSALGHRLGTAIPTFEVQISVDRFSYLEDHRIAGRAVVPGSFFLEMAIAAARELFPHQSRDVSDLAIRSPLYLDETGAATTVQFVLQDVAQQRFHIYAQPGGEHDWRLHVTGVLTSRASERHSPLLAPSTPGACLSTVFSPADFYRDLENAGISIGPRFQAIRNMRFGADEGVIDIALPAEIAGQADNYVVHPALIDAALQGFGALLVTVEGRAKSGSLSVLSEIGNVRLGAPAHGNLTVHVRRSHSAGGTVTGEATVIDDTGAVVLDMQGIRVRSWQQPARLATAEPAFWKVVWKPRERAAVTAGLQAPSLPIPGDFQSWLVQSAAELAVTTGFDQYSGFAAHLDRLCAALAARGLQQIGVSFQPGRRFSTCDLLREMGVVQRYARLTHRLLEILSEEGILQVDGDHWVVRQVPVTDARVASAADADAALFAAELTLTRRCGDQLAGVLRGEVDPLSLLFPSGEVSTADSLYTDSPAARVFNGLLQQVLGRAVQDFPDKADWRVLEIGAGTGGTTAYALPVFERGAAEYVFTDLSPAFLARARSRFCHSSCLKTAIFNVDESPDNQGFSPHTFDFVIAANVVHATASLRKSLSNAARLIRPGGWFVLLEGTRPERWVDLTFGLTEGWWRFEDTELRPHYPLIDVPQWTRLLRECGFEEPLAMRVGNRQQVLLIARMPSAVCRPVPWLLIPDRHGVAAAAAHELKQRGHACLLVEENDIAATVQQSAPAGVVDFTPLNIEPGMPMCPDALQAPQQMCTSIIACLRHLEARPDTAGARVWVVTRGGVVAGDQRIASPGQALAWGLGKTAALEMASLWGGIVDLDPAVDACTQAPALINELLAPDADYEIAFRAGCRLVPRMTSSRAPDAPSLCIHSDRGYLITGGLGALGLKVARRLAELGAKHLYLLSRTGLPDRDRWAAVQSGTRESRRIEAIKAMENLGAEVRWLVGDVSKEADMQHALGRFGRTEPTLAGVIHAAAHFDSTSVQQLTPTVLSAVVAPKAMGAVLLDTLTATQPLDFLVLFSSTTALLGARGLAHYAAANQFLDVFAHVRRWAGKPALSVNWGTWDDLSAATEESREYTLQSGLIPMDSARALDTLVRLLGSQEPQIAVASVNWDLLRSRYETRRARPLFEEMIAPRPNTPAHKTAMTPAHASTEMAQLPPSERADYVARRITADVAAILGMQPEEVQPNMGLFDLGMDSLMSVELRSRLEKAFGCTLPSTLIFNYPSAAALSRFIFTEMTEGDGLPTEQAEVAISITPELAGAGVVEATHDASEAELEAMLAAKLRSIR